MSVSSIVDSRFDGTCELSEDSDITLQFDDRSQLKAHAFILQKASPVLKCATEDCTNDNIIHLENTSRDVWIEILRELYPQTHSFIFRQVTQNFDNILEGFAMEAHKYGIACILYTLDEFIAWKVSNEDKRNPDNTCSRLMPFFRISGNCDLKQSKEAIATLLLEAIKQRQHNNHSEGAMNYHSCRDMDSVHKSIQLVIDTGDVEWSACVIGSILSDVLKLHVTLPTH